MRHVDHLPDRKMHNRGDVLRSDAACGSTRERGRRARDVELARMDAIPASTLITRPPVVAATAAVAVASAAAAGNV